MPRVAVVQRPTLNVAAGALVMRFSQYDDLVDERDARVPTIGMLYGSGTIGPENANISVGVGYGFVGSDLASHPVATLSGELRVRPRMSLVSENWIIPGETTLFGFGVRFLSHNASFDLAALTSSDAGGYFVPYLGVVMGF